VTTSVDANQHVQASYTDALTTDKVARTRYVLAYSGIYSGTLTANTLTTTQYNALDKPTSVTVTDLAPQSGQTVTSVTTTVTYDDMGRITSLNDPDRGTHTFTYDADNRQLTDVSGSRTIGVSYDLLGRAICMQDAAPTIDGSGNCTSGSHPLVQNSYDTSSLQVSGTTNYIAGRLGQSIATTYYPDGSSATTTQQFEYDPRGNSIATNQQISVPSSWNVTTALPTYLKRIAYNDDNQVTTTQTTVGSSAGYTFTQVYDSTTGMLNGLSNNSTGAANLASLAFNLNGQISDINFQTTTGTALANDHLSYDGNLRPVGANATWQSDSGATGTIFSTSRNYDPVGNVMSAGLTQSTVSGQSTSGGSETQNFCYDEENRLVWAGNNNPQPGAGNGTCGSATLGNTLPGAGYNSTYAYTHLGQIWQSPLNGTGGSQQYLYCNSKQPHQLTGVYPTGTTCSNVSGTTAAYSANYDSWGNMTSRTYGTLSATLSYDLLDHLVEWSSADNSNPSSSRQEWYAYDAQGNRVLRMSTSGGKTSITTYAFGLEEHSYDASGKSAGNTYYYTLSNRLIGQFDGTNTLFLLTDDLGSVLATFNNVAGSATVIANQAYGPYGNQLYSAGTMGTSKGFTGQYSDATGLDYYNARYYDPVVGQFISADHATDNATAQGKDNTQKTDTVEDNLHGFDPYGYVTENPETRIDPTGHDGSPATDKRGRSAAYMMAWQIAAWRQYKKDWDKADYADAMWYLTDQKNKGAFPFGADSFLGSHEIGMKKSARGAGGDTANDAEQKVLFPWLTNGGAAFAVAASKIARMMDVHATLHIVLFTELPPCKGCKNFFGGMFESGISNMATAIMNAPPAVNPWPTGEIAISFDVYSKNPAVTRGDWRVPITGPGDLVNSYHKDIPFIDPLPPAGVA